MDLQLVEIKTYSNSDMLPGKVCIILMNFPQYIRLSFADTEIFSAQRKSPSARLEFTLHNLQAVI